MAVAASGFQLRPIHLSFTAWAIFLLAIAVSWYLAIVTSPSLTATVTPSLIGPHPLAWLTLVVLVLVMMVAMMLPAAGAMLFAYGGMARLDVGGREGTVRGFLFAFPYFLVWGGAAGLILVALAGLGLMGTLFGWTIWIPAGLLFAAGIYQFTSAKRYCLSGCQSPFGFIMTHWRGGRQGALSMGFAHAEYCLGCCVMLMFVLFVTGAMSLLWMGGISALILVERSSVEGSRWPWIIGGVCIVLGGIVAAGAFLARTGPFSR